MADGKWTTIPVKSKPTDGKKKKAAKAPAAAPVQLNILGKPIGVKTKNLFAEASEAVEARKAKERLADELRRAAEEEAKRKDQEAKEKLRQKQQIAFEKQQAAAMRQSPEERGALLSADRIRMRITAGQVKYPLVVDAQLMALVDFLEEGFAGVAAYEWNRKLSSALVKGTTDEIPLSLINKNACGVIRQWLQTQPIDALRSTIRNHLIPAAFPEIACVAPPPRTSTVESQHIGVRIFIQIALQAVPDIIHPKQAVMSLGSNPTHAQMEACTYILLQAGHSQPSTAYRGWHMYVHPVMCAAGASKSYVSPLVWFLASPSIRKAKNAVSGDVLVPLVKLAFQSDAPLNREMQSLLPAILEGASYKTDGRQILPALLGVVGRCDTSVTRDDAVMNALTKCLAMDKLAFDAWCACHRKHGVATAQLVIHLHSDWKKIGSYIPGAALVTALTAMEATWNDPPPKGVEAVAADMAEERAEAAKSLRRMGAKQSKSKGGGGGGVLSSLVWVVGVGASAAAAYVGACIYTACGHPLCQHVATLCARG